jgi:hypothetical protein
MMRRRPPNPAKLAAALRRRVPGPFRHRPTVQVRVFDERGHARTLDAREGQGRYILAAAEDLLRAASVG